MYKIIPEIVCRGLKWTLAHDRKYFFGLLRNLYLVIYLIKIILSNVFLIIKDNDFSNDADIINIKFTKFCWLINSYIKKSSKTLFHCLTDSQIKTNPAKSDSIWDCNTVHLTVGKRKKRTWFEKLLDLKLGKKLNFSYDIYEICQERRQKLNPLTRKKHSIDCNKKSSLLNTFHSNFVLVECMYVIC